MGRGLGATARGASQKPRKSGRPSTTRNKTHPPPFSSSPPPPSLSPLPQEAVLDSIIERLVDARSGRPGRAVQLTEAEIRGLCTSARDVLMTQPNLLELEAEKVG